MEKRTATLLGVLVVMTALYVLSRTAKGALVVADATDAVLSSLPRGIRNNNPGNIDWIADPSKRWRGMIDHDGRFGIFDTPAHGVRAIGGELKASIRRGQTIEQAIHEWAPPVENDTGAYVRYVAGEVGASKSAPLELWMLPAVATAIIRHENGVQPYAAGDIKAWVYS